MIQDAPVSDPPLSAVFLARMAKEIPNVRYFKIEVVQAATKVRQMIELLRWEEVDEAADRQARGPRRFVGCLRRSAFSLAKAFSMG